MPRTLPWLVNGSKQNEKKRTKAPSSPPPRLQRDDTPEDLVDADLNPIGSVTPQRREKKRAARTPSTSPPPAPPDVEYMREGYNADDAYMMVEDEFLSTAKMFTQHMHHAEYVRFKKLAKSRGEGVLEAINRPVDGKTQQSKGLKMQMEAEERAKGIKNAMGEEDDSDADDFLQDPQLAGLMMGGMTGSKDLTELAKAKSHTRAAAGFAQSPRNVERIMGGTLDDQVTASEPISSLNKAKKLFDEDVYSDEDDDDLDASSSRAKTSDRARPGKGEKTPNGFDKDMRDTRRTTKSDASSIFKQFASESNSSWDGQKLRNNEHSLAITRTVTRTVTETSPVSIDEPENSKSKAAVDSHKYLAKRKADRERREREEKRKANEAIDIPTFAF